VESENSQQIFSGQIMHAGQRNEAKRALEDIQNKHKDIIKIEKSIIELHQLFMDLSVMLAAQGEVIDQIAVHVNNAAEDTAAGVKDLGEAVKIQKRSRKVILLYSYFRECV
jgi:t-SNARE complex subunit (syntaxin)